MKEKCMNTLKILILCLPLSLCAMEKKQQVKLYTELKDTTELSNITSKTPNLDKLIDQNKNTKQGDISTNIKTFLTSSKTCCDCTSSEIFDCDGKASNCFYTDCFKDVKKIPEYIVTSCLMCICGTTYCCIECGLELTRRSK